MLRLTLMLGAALYAAMVILPDRLPGDPFLGAEVARASLAVDVLVPIRAQTQDILLTQDGRTLVISAVIEPSLTLDATHGVAMVSTRRADRPETVVASSSGGLPERDLVEITGNHVNLRAGPSTDTAVLGALVRGDRAELIAASGDGWVQIRAVSTGTIGYMADRFVSPVN
ncbi:SH3 domain-containing protein [Roseicyclus mahoneyensis]|uniref:SH3 domain-containing protein n=1 Tax=Roseicyclus mahoneyensis TaxID=164332 RepID=A0A316GGY9_9RHOB|nr:SH3 domain-containing protein [Roseicyclus mahoneyensis]PWK60292.1 SH3 domain-containing protein [Roseicyclus mahoneyensis]